MIWTYGNDITVRAYCWGGGGGGGGNDSALGGTGSGGSFGYNEFTVNNGDVIDVAVGGSGGGGATGSQASGGGSPGGGYLLQEIFNTRNNIPSGWTTPTNPSYSQFLNTYGVWPNNYSIEVDYTWTISVSGGEFVFQTGFDCPRRNANIVDPQIPRIIVSVDGTDRFWVMPATNYFDSDQRSNPGQSMIYNVTLSAGTHTVRIRNHPNNYINQFGPGSFAMRIAAPSGSFSGARGGSPGYSGTSGAGGGGGGATTVFLNSTLIACGGGGGGGGGGGNGPVGDNAPGAAGQASPGTNNGQNGVNKNGDGGGGGGGGGGYGGGQGGGTPGGDIGGQAGSNGGSFGIATASSSNQAPAGSGYSFYNPNVARGGAAATSGGGGVCVLEFFVSGVNVKTASGWQPVTATYVKQNGLWQPMQAGYIKTAGSWQYFINSFAPVFQTDPLTYGVNSRAAPANQPAEDVPPIYDSGGGYDFGGWGHGDGWGGGDWG